MSVDDSGLEALRKSAVQITPGSPAEYRIRTESTGPSGAPLPVTDSHAGPALTATVATSTTPALAIGTTGPLASRQGIYIQANQAGHTFGFSATFGAGEGLMLGTNSPIYIPAGALAVYVRKNSGTGSVLVWEVK